MNDICVSKSAADLPQEWDELCETMLQQRKMLIHYERYNYCAQRYYLLLIEGVLTAGAIVYTRIQNVLTFTGNIYSPVKINFIGLPASISPSGVIGNPQSGVLLLNEIFQREKGFLLCMNLPADYPRTIACPVRLLPGIVFDNHFDTINSYQNALRSPYRRRMKRIIQSGIDIRVVRNKCNEFTSEHHNLYLAVLQKAKEKLETLSIEFFKNLPAPIELVSCYQNDVLVSWRLVLLEGSRYIFILGGHSYEHNEQYEIYFNNLFGVLEEGIGRGVLVIDFGQTAEDAKARLGAMAIEEKMLMYHSNWLIRKILVMIAPLLAYKMKFPIYQIFKRHIS